MGIGRGFFEFRNKLTTGLKPAFPVRKTDGNTR